MFRTVVTCFAVLFLLASLLATSAPARRGSPTAGFVPVPHGTLFYEESGAGPAVILIHGGMLDHEMWDPQLEALTGFRVVRYDVAAHGRSPKPEQAWNDVEQLAALMGSLEVGSASLVGLSMGGRIAIDFAIAHPDKVRSLVLVDPGLSGYPFTGRDFAAGMRASARARRAGDAARAAELFLRSWLAGPHRTPSAVDPEVWARALQIATPNALTRAEGEALAPPAVGRLAEISVPTLVIEGELDCEDIHRIGRLIERRVPGARRVVIRGVAHMPNLERAAEVNGLLRSFLLEPPAPPPARKSLAARAEWLEVEGGKLWVERSGEGEALLLIHDGIVHSAGWDDVLPALATQYEVIRFDRRGYGRSTVPAARFSDLADLEALVRHLALGRLHIVGSSAGGGLAIDFALAHPEQVRTLTLVGAVVSGFPYTRHFGSRGGRLTAAALNDSTLGRHYWTQTDPYFIAPQSKAVRERVAAILEAAPQNLDPAKGRFATPRPPALPRLPSIRVPTLVLLGEHDIPDVHAHGGAIAAGIPNARREVLSDCGHVPYLEVPGDFATTVLAFLQGAPFQEVLDNEGPRQAKQFLRDARAKDPAAVLFAEDELNDRGYLQLARGASEEAVALFRLNCEAYPASANTWDSLGEALLAAGDREGSTAAYERSLEIDPSSASARAALEKLRHDAGDSGAQAPVWQVQASGTRDALTAVWGVDGSTVFAVGRNGTVLRFDGTGWSRWDIGSPAHLVGIWGTASTNLIVTGDQGLALRYDGKVWNRMDSGTTANLDAVWGSCASDVFAVGDSGGIVLHYDGTEWSRMASTTSVGLFGVWGAGPGDVFAVGMQGTILRYDGQAWAPMASGVTEHLTGIWGSSKTDVFAVGSAGTILHYDGRAWTPMSSGTQRHVFRVWGRHPADVFAVGAEGTILHFDGARWSSMPSPSEFDLYSVWGTAMGTVFATGREGTLLQH
ncbi:MAG: alpha/beta fold hydrolase [Acidobacteria bacterium]|nr:alpha/beta fold hydrolase [Acidobacteriota bacterium]